MGSQPHPSMHSLTVLVQQDLAFAYRYAKMVVHRFTSRGSDKLLHLPSLGVKHFPFNVALFSQTKYSSHSGDLPSSICAAAKGPACARAPRKLTRREVSS